MKTTFPFLTILAVTFTSVLAAQSQQFQGTGGNSNAVAPASGRISPSTGAQQPANGGMTPAPNTGAAAPNSGAVIPPSRAIPPAGAGRVAPNPGAAEPDAGTVIPPAREVPPAGARAVAPNTGAPMPNPRANDNSFAIPGTNGPIEPRAPGTNGFYRGPRSGGYLGGTNGSVN